MTSYEMKTVSIYKAKENEKLSQSENFDISIVHPNDYKQPETKRDHIHNHEIIESATKHKDKSCQNRE